MHEFRTSHQSQNVLMLVKPNRGIDSRTCWRSKKIHGNLLTRSTAIPTSPQILPQCLTIRWAQAAHSQQTAYFSSLLIFTVGSSTWLQCTCCTRKGGCWRDTAFPDTVRQGTAIFLPPPGNVVLKLEGNTWLKQQPWEISCSLVVSFPGKYAGVWKA